MTALAANVIRDHQVTFRAPTNYPVNDGSKILVCAYVCREAATNLVVPGADAAGLVPLGVATRPPYSDAPDQTLSAAFDNTDGPDGTYGDPGTRNVQVGGAGHWAFKVSGGTPRPGEPAYLVDDNTVSAAATTYSIIAGYFVRPAPTSGEWYIDVARRATQRVTSDLVETQTLALSGAGTVQGDATALTAFGVAEFTTVGSGTGAKLPAGSAGKSILVINAGANALKVYPSTGGAIDAEAANAAVSMPAATVTRFHSVSATQWYTHPTI